MNVLFNRIQLKFTNDFIAEENRHEAIQYVFNEQFWFNLLWFAIYWLFIADMMRLFYFCSLSFAQVNILQKKQSMKLLKIAFKKWG